MNEPKILSKYSAHYNKKRFSSIIQSGSKISLADISNPDLLNLIGMAHDQLALSEKKPKKNICKNEPS